MFGPTAGAHKPTRRIFHVNAAILVISSALATGGDVTTAEAWGDGPTVVQAQGCSGCGPKVASPCGCSKPSLLDKIKAHLTPKPSCGCKPAPAPTCKTCETASYRPNLLDKIKSWSCKKPSCGCGPVASPCATPGAPVVPLTTPPTTPPKDMPKPKDVPKSDAPKTSGNTGSVPLPLIPLAPPIAPTPGGIPTIPAAPISTGTTPGGTSPY
jgi:hypothetical protein